MKNTKTEITTDLNFTNLLTIAFIILKLTHVIDWSWWWVISPLWIPLAILVVIWLVSLFITAIWKE